ncbi:hypothetical protein ACCD10_17725 [Pseudomonas sp. Pseusp122]|uniref:hypothetical protein n=1 Tax=unclassified Pseudomonas TaxID=196821 RepID=UPI0039A63B3D
MRLIKPVEISEAKLISSNVPESDYPAWSSTATYAIAARVLLNHNIWEAFAAVPAGVKPGEEVVTATAPAKWQLIGADNRWRMFDAKVESLTTNAGTITVRLRPGAVVNSLAMFNVAGRTVTVTMVDPVEGERYRRVISLVDGGVTNWYDYFFSEIDVRTDLVLLDMPAYGTADILVTVDAGSGTAAVGHIVVGAWKKLGDALYGSSVGINDYSRKSTDDFGNTSVVRRSYSNRADFDIALETAQVAKIRRLLADQRGIPTVWVGEETYEATILFGFYKDFNIVLAGPKLSSGTITVEGLV